MVHSTYWLEYRLWELEPSGYHAVNILFHALAALFLWAVLGALGLRGAWVAAALFAVHPVHVESVAWITERKNVLSLVFYLGAALAYLRFALPSADARDRRRWPFYIAALVLFMGALLSKTVTGTLPAALLLVLCWKRSAFAWRDLSALLPFFALGVGFGLVTVWLEKHHVGASGLAWDLSFVDRCLIAGRALWFYAGKLLCPVNLTFTYPRWEIDAAQLWQYVYPLAAVAVVLILWFMRKRLGGGPLTAVLFFAGTLFPALGFFDVYPMQFSFVADHFQYHASVGLTALAAAAGYAAFAGRGRAGIRIGTGVLACVLVLFGALTWMQCPAYFDHDSLWRDTIEKNPGAWMAHNNLGTSLDMQGKPEEAILCYRNALRANKNYDVAHCNLGRSLQRLKRLDDAVFHLREAVRLNPQNIQAQIILGTCLLNLGRPAEAASRFVEALGHLDDDREFSAVQVTESKAHAHNYLGTAYYAQADLDKAVEHFREAIRLKPDLVAAHHGLSIALTDQGRFDEAAEHLTEVLRLRPDAYLARQQLRALQQRTKAGDEPK